MVYAKITEKTSDIYLIKDSESEKFDFTVKHPSGVLTRFKTLNIYDTYRMLMILVKAGFKVPQSTIDRVFKEMTGQ